MSSDTLGARGRIGIILPSTNTSMEAELSAMQPSGVSNHVGRMTIPNMPLTSDAEFQALVEALAASQSAAIDSVMSCAPDHLVYGLSAETFYSGVAAGLENTRAMARQAGVGVSAVSEAMVAALTEFGFRKIAVLTPYQPIGDARVKAFFEVSGFDVLALTGLKRPSAIGIGQTPRRDLTAALIDLAKCKPDVIVQVGTNLPMARIARVALDWIGVPVLSANTVVYRDALRQIGVLDDAAFTAQWMPVTP